MSTGLEELAIRDLNARYIDAVNRYNKDDWAATWSSTATWNLMGMEVDGRDAIVELWTNAMSGFEFAIMMLNSGTITVEGNSARGRWYITEHLKMADGSSNMTLGVYDDEYGCEDGNWLFTRRSYQVIYQGPPDLSGNFTPYRPD